jgi:hypothetical protein
MASERAKDPAQASGYTECGPVTWDALSPRMTKTSLSPPLVDRMLGGRCGDAAGSERSIPGAADCCLHAGHK